MKTFKDLGIKPSVKSLVGSKMKINRTLNKQIVVTDFRIVPSKYDDNDECLHLQFELGGNKHVMFTGAKILIETIRQVPKEEFPFITTIIQEEEWYEFS